MQGWVKLYRKILTDPVWLLSTPEQKVILITLLMMANHQAKQWVWQGEKFEVAPGQFITSIDSIRDKAGKGISAQNVRTALKRFEKLEFLTNKSTKTGRLINVVNWAKYQDENIELTKQLTKTSQRPNKDLTPNKNVKNVKKDSSASAATEKDPIPYAKIIDYLNEKTGKKYKNAASHRKYIRARWNEGQRLDDFKRVIDIKSAEWLYDDKMIKYLQPSTLFGNKFDSYLNSKVTKPKSTKKSELDEREKAKKLNHYIWNRYTNDNMTPDQIQQSLTEMSMTVNLDYIKDVITKLEARSR